MAEIQRTDDGEALVTLRDGSRLRVRPDTQPEILEAT